MATEKALLEAIKATHEFMQEQARQTQSQHKDLISALQRFELNRPAQPELTIEALSSSIDAFSYDPDNNVTFDVWYSKYEDVFKEDARILDDSGRTRLLLRRLDNIAHARYANYILPAAPRDKDFEATVNILRKIFGKGESVFAKRWQCLQMQKSLTDDFTTYAGKVNRACEDFQLSSVTPDYFKCLIFLLGLQGETYAEIRRRLLNKLATEDATAVNLELMLTEAKHFINLKTDSDRIGDSSGKNETTSLVNKVLESTKVNKPNQHHKNSGKSDKKIPKSPCWLCGSMHYVRDCTYTEHMCTECNRKGHREGYCEVSKPRTATPNAQSRDRPPRVNMIANAVSDRKFISVRIDGKLLSLLYDTGSDLTIISQGYWKSLGSPSLTPVRHLPQDAQGNNIQLLGEFLPLIVYNDTQKRGRCVVAEGEINLFGTDWITLFGLWDTPITMICNNVSSCDYVTALKQRFPRVFSATLGKCTKGSASLLLKPNAQPVFRPKRPVPFHIMEAVEEELQRLVNLEIITPVDYSEYAAPIVVARKQNGKIRICADYSSGLNNNLEFHRYPIPTPIQIFASLANCSVFSQLDLSDAYLQIEMDEEARKMLTINTHRGLFTFNRLCPGVKSAPGIFQQTVDTMLAGLQGVTAYFDDILVASQSHEEHMDLLDAIFKRLDNFDFRVRLDKCKFFQKEIKFLGVFINADGQRPDPEKTLAITAMPAPTNINELRSFLGAITFYSKFVKSLSSLRAPLDKLLHADQPWDWTAECQQTFTHLKNILTSDLLLTHYHPTLPIILAGDASQVGIGCVGYHILPDSSVKAFHHASRSLTGPEKGYSQTEKEGLALIFAVTKLHQYIFGRRFTLQTDHKPLLAIFGSKKGIPTHSASRLQRWALILLTYSFDIEYINTESFGYADVLSRLIAEQPTNDQDDFIVAEVRLEEIASNEFAQNVSTFTPVTFKTVKEATGHCTILITVIEYVSSGWPVSKRLISSREVQKFFDLKESLALRDGCLLYRDRLVIPQSLRQSVLTTLHSGHPGIVRMKALARCFVFWPWIDKDISNLVTECVQCALAAKCPVKCELYSWPLCTRPWQRVHVDFAGPLKGMYFFVMVDAFSKWPEVYPTKTITASATISWMRETCSRYGFMEIVVSDNGTQFTSSVFANFCDQHGIQHIRTAPYHPQSNGQVERFVDTLKRGLQKNSDISDMSQALQTLLMAYRNTPNDSTHDGSSPALLMFGRQLRIQLSLLKSPEEPCIQRNLTMERQFNEKHGARPRSFSRGDRVYVKYHMRNSFKWVAGKVIERIGSVNYNVQVFLASGSKLSRVHINHLNPRAAPVNGNTDDSWDIVLQDTPAVTAATPGVCDHPETPRTSHASQTAVRRQLIPPPFLPTDDRDDALSF